MINIIACVNSLGAISTVNNEIPVVIPQHIQNISALTNGNIVIMGRLTWESLGAAPMPNRLTGVITRRKKNPRIKNVKYFKNTLAAINYYKSSEFTGKGIYVLGGEAVFGDTIGMATTLYMTEVEDSTLGEKYFPPYDKSKYKVVDESTGIANGNKYSIKELHKV